MSEQDVDSLPLSKLASRLNRSGEFRRFARILAERLQDGREAEVAKFFRSCKAEYIGELDSAYREHLGAPWNQSHELWLAFARLTLPRNHLLGGNCRVPQRSPALSAEMQAAARDCLARNPEEEWQRKSDRSFVRWDLCRWFWYEGMPLEECQSLLDWLLSIEESAERGANWRSLVEGLNDTVDLLSLAERGKSLGEVALEVYGRRIARLPTADGWAPWEDFCARHPDLWVENPGFVAWRWPAADAVRRESLARALSACLDSGFRDIRSQARELFDRLVREDSQPFVEALSSDVELGAAYQIWHGQYPELLPLVLPSIAHDCEYCDYSGNEVRRRFRRIVRRYVAGRPDDLAVVPVHGLVHLLPLLDARALKAALPVLGKVVGGSSSKALRAAMLQLGAKIDPADLAASGWLAKTPKNRLLTGCEILLAHPSRSVGAVLAELLASGKLDAAMTSRVAARLQALGLDGASEPAGNMQAVAADEAPLGTLEAQAATVKRLATALKHYESPGVLGLLAPLSEHAARVLLHLTATATDELPPLATALLAAVPAYNRASFALALAEAWIALDGAPKQRWALKLLPGHADERAVDALATVVQRWAGSKRQRAIAALEHLGAVDSLYALGRVQRLTASRKLRGSVLEAAESILIRAARQRRMSLAELYDELTPDFGLREGLVLQVGPQAYRVELQGDLSLRVVNDKGKSSKSLPALKDESLHADWESANARLKGVVTGVKEAIRQQGARMEVAFITGKTWSRVRWQQLFLDHPLLRILGRSLIWQVADGAPGFRIAEDFSLVDVQDESVTLPAECQIGLWHPVTAAAGEVDAWKTHLDDYALTPLVDQIGAATDLPAPEQLQGEGLHPPAPLTLTQSAFGRLLNQWCYRAGPILEGQGSEREGIYEHRLYLPAAQLEITLHHSRDEPYFEANNRIEIKRFQVDAIGERRQRLAPADLPKPLLATLTTQLRALEQAAVAAADVA